MPEWDSFTEKQKLAYAKSENPEHAGVEASLELLEWLWDAGVSAVVGDAISWEVSLFGFIHYMSVPGRAWKQKDHNEEEGEIGHGESRGFSIANYNMCLGIPNARGRLRTWVFARRMGHANWFVLPFLLFLSSYLFILFVNFYTWN